MQLPFHRGKDILDEDEVLRGPAQKCLTCGRDAGRGFEPVVCENCRAALHTGRRAFGERKLYTVQHRDLLDYLYGSRTTDLSKRLIELILELLGTRFAGEYTAYGDPDGKPVDTLAHPARKNGRNWEQKVFLTPEQFSDIQALLAHVNEMGAAAHKGGRERGESILLQLAANALSVDDFNRASVHHDRFAPNPARDGNED